MPVDIFITLDNASPNWFFNFFCRRQQQLSCSTTSNHLLEVPYKSFQKETQERNGKMTAADALGNVVKAPVDLTKNIVGGGVDMTKNVLHKTADVGRGGVDLAVDTTSEGANVVKSPFENFMNQLMSCFGLF